MVTGSGVSLFVERRGDELDASCRVANDGSIIARDTDQPSLSANARRRTRRLRRRTAEPAGVRDPG